MSRIITVKEYTNRIIRVEEYMDIIITVKEYMDRIARLSSTFSNQNRNPFISIVEY